jgi:hypothetical protein
MEDQSMCLLTVNYLRALTATNMKFGMGISYKEA